MRNTQVYIWVFVVLSFLFYSISAQLVSRRTRIKDELVDKGTFLLGASWFLASTALHLVVSPLFVIVFIRNMNRLLAHPLVATRLTSQKINELHALTIRSAIYVNLR